MSDSIQSKIIRLNSGIDVIAKIVNSNKKSLTLEKPFIFKTNIVTDPFSGARKEITTLQSWLSFSEAESITISKDIILAFLPPTEETDKLYTIEKGREENLKKNRSVTNYGNQEEIQKQHKGNQPNPIQDILNQFNAGNAGSLDEMMKKLQDDIDNMADEFDFPEEMDEDDMQEFIVMTLMIPPNLLEKMVKEGIIKPSDMADYLYDNIKEKVTEEYTGEDNNHPDYGNRWTDWSNDLKDYL